MRSDTIAAILIDPDLRRISPVRLPVLLPAHETKRTARLELDMRHVAQLLACPRVLSCDLMPNDRDALVYNELLDEENLPTMFFQLAEDWPLIAGRCVMCGLDLKWRYRDVSMTVAELEASAIWTRRIVRSYRVATSPDATIYTTLVAPIVEEF